MAIDRVVVFMKNQLVTITVKDNMMGGSDPTRAFVPRTEMCIAHTESAQQLMLKKKRWR
jgi:hypothetical protein